MNIENPSYIQSDYMTDLGDNQVAGEQPAGVVSHPTNQFKRSEVEAHQRYPYHYRKQHMPIPSGDQPLPYSQRSDIAPYTLNYEYANSLESMAYAPKGFGGIFDQSVSNKLSPFRTAMATSSIILLGAVVGEMIVKMSFEDYFSKQASSFYQKKKLPTGYGALVGAITANALRMGIASGIGGSFTDGLKAFSGAILPVSVPIGLTFAKSQSIKKGKVALVGGGLFFLALPIIVKQFKKE